MDKLKKIQELKLLLDDNAIGKNDYNLLLREIIGEVDLSKEKEDASNVTTTLDKDYTTTELIKAEDYGEGQYRITKWLKTISAKIDKGDPLVEIESDKVTIEIVASCDGVLIEQLLPIGTLVNCNANLGRVEKDEIKGLEFVKEFNSKELNFETCIIGTQEWMTENLKVKYFRNGDIINEAQSKEDWIKFERSEEPAWGYYNDDPVNEDKYGLLYNRWAIEDEREIAPQGWKVPCYSDFKILIDRAGGDTNAGKALKSRDGWHKSIYDDNDNESIVSGLNGINKYGFNLLPGGVFAGFEDEEYSIGYEGIGCKSSLAHNKSTADFRGKSHEVHLFESSCTDIAISVRCIKD